MRGTQDGVATRPDEQTGCLSVVLSQISISGIWGIRPLGSLRRIRIRRRRESVFQKFLTPPAFGASY